MASNHKKIGDISNGASKDYFQDFKNVFLKIEVSDSKGKAMLLDRAIVKIINLIIRQHRRGNKIILIGNGGSASISSHIATDFLKNAKIRALAFNDASLITCLSNDLGYEHVFRKPLEILSKRGDILFSISSSGESRNILQAAKEAKKKGCFIISLSGFSKANTLRKTGDVNFYFPSNSYGYVEIAHLIICHNIVDRIIEGSNP